ncbi:hypothetical protein [Candidatus Poriferisocius sp.]|uniref:hypothetical protein n=1 Tax=Candidatus Poriferisocius sp. TaxID=3101276 RepID=UPI003B025C3B
MSGFAPSRRDDSGETLAFLVLWPVLLVAILVLLVHTFIVVNAQAEAEVAASAGLRAAWRSAAASDLRAQPEDVAAMADEAKDAAASVAGRGEGWRWWTPGATEVKSDWCHAPLSEGLPQEGEAGWVQVKVEGEVFGPMAALWPGRLDRVYAVASGPAVLDQQIEADSGYVLPAQNQLAVC